VKRLHFLGLFSGILLLAGYSTPALEDHGQTRFEQQQNNAPDRLNSEQEKSFNRSQDASEQAS
jgi:hypothetical protein